ncbi:helix-turn-helix transcriptional regulator [Actinocorallia populi]|uniref:helix-turn-helix transcriptional regulator n=1 Tax=Actinocorallia populi TaxID=2079200 RepID=UPI000D09259F|nr:WYL domain-containing protein [Actinocorallia populi]
MRDPSDRLLRLLSLLQTPREWPGPELADRLGVTPRTIRRDVERLRRLGYPVHAAQGNIGGYRLTSGTAMPPLLLDDDEAIAVAVGLGTAATAAIDGVEEASLRALAKLEQVLPSRLRHRVTALSEAAVVLPRPDGPAAQAADLASLAAACAAREKVRFAYAKPHSEPTRRLVEPHRLVVVERLWYLVAYDEDRAAWRSFRADRISEVHRTGVRVPARELPGGVDTRTWVTRAMPPRDVRARLLLHVPFDRAASQVPAWQGTLEPVDDTSCLLHTAPDSPRYLAHRITLLPVPYTLLDPPELAAHLRTIAEQAAHAVRHH